MTPRSYAPMPTTAARLAARDDLLAEFARTLLDEWESVPPAERDVWLRWRLGDLLDRRPGIRGRWIPR